MVGSVAWNLRNCSSLGRGSAIKAKRGSTGGAPRSQRTPPTTRAPGAPHLAHGRLQRELRHLAPQPRQQPLLVERAQVVQLLERADQRRRGRGVHEVEAQEVVDAHGLEGQHLAVFCVVKTSTWLIYMYI